ncbi:MAG: hypothetical protein ACXWMF_04990 [Syntrophales bacterium]
MINILTSGGTVSEELLGLTEYYSCILSNTELLKKECEFRSKKLGLILDFIRAIDIPESLESELTTAIIKSWRMKIPETTLILRENEQRKIMGSINSIKNVAYWMERCKAPINSVQLNFRVLSNLPLVPSDLQPDDAPRIYNLISHVMDCCTSFMGDGLNNRPDVRSL